jgi:hypothetical protein
MASARPKILCLGVSYPNIEAVLEESDERRRRTMVDPNVIVPTADTAIQCVKQKLLTQMDGRDLARCLATEEHCQVDVYCVSQEKGSIYREDRHLDANFNRASFVKLLKKQFGQECRFDQIILDYFWIPAGWDVHHWSNRFFESTLVDLAPLLSAFPPSLMNGSVRRGIFLPFCFHCFQAILTHEEKLRKYYNILFLRNNELSCVTLWAGTQCIDAKQMQTVLGKRKDQEEFYCTFTARHMREMEGGGGSKEALMELASSLEDFAAVRFIVLEPLPIGAEHSNQQQTTGRFLGLTPPSRVKRGLKSGETSRASTPSRLQSSRCPMKRPISCESKDLVSNRTKSRYNFRQRSPRSAMDALSSAVSSESIRERALLPRALFPKSKQND